MGVSVGTAGWPRERATQLGTGSELGRPGPRSQRAGSGGSLVPQVPASLGAGSFHALEQTVQVAACSDQLAVLGQNLENTLAFSKGELEHSVRTTEVPPSQHRHQQPLGKIGCFYRSSGKDLSQESICFS